MTDKFPGWRYGPAGQSAIFESADDVPTGWQDHPSKVSGKSAGRKPKAKPEDTATAKPKAKAKAGRKPKAKPAEEAPAKPLDL